MIYKFRMLQMIIILKFMVLKITHTLINNDSTNFIILKINKEIDENTNLKTTLTLYEDLSKNTMIDINIFFLILIFNKSIELDENYNGNFFSSSGYQKNLYY